MAYYIQGPAVPNATSYELAEKSGSTYTTLATASSISFDLSALSFAVGSHTLVVKAKASGYADSSWSNEVTYTVSEDGGGSGDNTPKLTINIEEGSLGSDSGNEIAYTNVWRTEDYIAVADLTNTLSVVGSTWLIATFNSNYAYQGQLKLDLSGLIKNSGQWLDSEKVVPVSTFSESWASSVKYIRIVLKTDSPKILINGEDCFGALVS